MIISNPKNTQSFRVNVLNVKFNKKGNLRLKVVSRDNPEEEPGFITFSAADLAKIKKALEEEEPPT